MATSALQIFIINASQEYYVCHSHDQIQMFPLGQTS